MLKKKTKTRHDHYKVKAVITSKEEEGITKEANHTKAFRMLSVLFLHLSGGYIDDSSKIVFCTFIYDVMYFTIISVF